MRRNINLAHTNIVEEHRYKRYGQGRRGTPPIRVNEYIQKCKVERMLDGARYETIPDITFGSGLKNVSGTMTYQESWNKSWDHTGGSVSK